MISTRYRAIIRGMARQPVGFRAGEPGETAAVFARVPLDDARRLDRASFALGKPKREILAALLSTLDVEGEAGVGVHAFASLGPKEVLTLEETAALLEVAEGAVLELAEAGRMPARRVGAEWRFARAAVLAWLGGRSGV
jgi:excisionase family DNA binding protein